MERLLTEMKLKSILKQISQLRHISIKLGSMGHPLNERNLGVNQHLMVAQRVAILLLF